MLTLRFKGTKISSGVFEQPTYETLQAFRKHCQLSENLVNF